MLRGDCKQKKKEEKKKKQICFKFLMNVKAFKKRIVMYMHVYMQYMYSKCIIVSVIGLLNTK